MKRELLIKLANVYEETTFLKPNKPFWFLFEYDEEKLPDYGYEGRCGEFVGDVAEAYLLSEHYGFVDWLVENKYIYTKPAILRAENIISQLDYSNLVNKIF